MNILCGPFLYVMPECDAYYSFSQLLTRHCPRYMAPQLKGVEAGCALMDQCLKILDPELFDHLQAKGITARIYALPMILSLFACMPPLKQLLRVWDALFAIGVHFVVLLAVSHALLLREQLLQRDTDLMKILSVRYAPPLCADLLLSVAFQIMHRLPDDLLYKIARHTCDYPDSPKDLPYSKTTFELLLKRASLASSEKKSTKRTSSDYSKCKKCSNGLVHVTVNASDKHRGKRKYNVRPPWK
uniref:Uncharacterized protein AlNc14C105G6183 n=1 Tax=Albugo laibachii Nc14 TaxID=890382 RepID=F0WHX6_9STRA|nr:conserved hypothetical protein [Albugo laibachii Nc14]|eukprot:CCA20853.1 conserved hypothetical protein [Albugo laibachii Nc14]